MASIPQELDDLEKCGVVFYVKGGQLFVEGLARLNDPELSGWIRKHRKEIVEEVKARDRQRSQKARLNERRFMPGHCQCCGGTSFWINQGGSRVCAVCSPSVRPDLFPVYDS